MYFDFNTFLAVFVSGTIMAVVVWFLTERMNEAFERSGIGEVADQILLLHKKIDSALERIDRLESLVDRHGRDIDALKIDVRVAQEALRESLRRGR